MITIMLDLFIGFVTIYAMLIGMENLAMTCIGLLGTLNPFYIHSQTKRPSSR